MERAHEQNSQQKPSALFSTQTQTWPLRTECLSPPVFGGQRRWPLLQSPHQQTTGQFWLPSLLRSCHLTGAIAAFCGLARQTLQRSPWQNCLSNKHPAQCGSYEQSGHIGLRSAPVAAPLCEESLLLSEHAATPVTNCMLQKTDANTFKAGSKRTKEWRLKSQHMLQSQHACDQYMLDSVNYTQQGSHSRKMRLLCSRAITIRQVNPS